MHLFVDIRELVIGSKVPLLLLIEKGSLIRDVLDDLRDAFGAGIARINDRPPQERPFRVKGMNQ